MSPRGIKTKNTIFCKRKLPEEKMGAIERIIFISLYIQKKAKYTIFYSSIKAKYQEFITDSFNGRRKERTLEKGKSKKTIHILKICTISNLQH